jgi:hypothetical protein
MDPRTLDDEFSAHDLRSRSLRAEAIALEDELS